VNIYRYFDCIQIYSSQSLHVSTDKCDHHWVVLHLHEGKNSTSVLPFYSTNRVQEDNFLVSHKAWVVLKEVKAHMRAYFIHKYDRQSLWSLSGLWLLSLLIFYIYIYNTQKWHCKMPITVFGILENVFTYFYYVSNATNNCRR